VVAGAAIWLAVLSGTADAREITWPGGKHIVVDQRLNGLAVDRAPLVKSVSPTGKIRRTKGQVVRQVKAVEPALSKSEALAAVTQDVGTSRRISHAKAELVYVVVAEEPVLAWAVTGTLDRPFLTFRTWVDAATGRIVAGDITSRSALGNVYPTNPSISEVEEVELVGLTSDTTLAGEYAVAVSCDDWIIEDGMFGRTDCLATGSHAVPDADGNYLYQPDPGSTDDPFAEVHGYFHTDYIAAWLDARYGFRQAEAPITVIMNFPMANAFYGDFDGDGIPDLSFGHVPDNGVDFGHDADVVYHEYGHAIVGKLAGNLPFMRADSFGMEWVAGSINEGTADIWSMVLTGDPLTGEYAGSGFERDAIRDLEEDKTCPGNLRGEVHADGEVLAAFGWNLIDDPAIGPEVTADLMYGAIPFWDLNVDWPTVGTSILDSAADLLDAGAIESATHDAIVAHLEASTILDCGRVIPLDDGQTLDMFLFNGGLYEDLERIPMGVQFSVDVPKDATSVRFVVEEVTGHDGMGWSLYGRVGKHIEHRSTEVAVLGLGFATAETFDWMVDGEKEGVVELTVGGDPPLTPGETQYFAVSSRNLGDIPLLDFQFGHAILHAEIDTGNPGEEPRGGCGCDTGGAPIGWPLLAVLLVFRRREW